jgi:hypothetical protein
MQPFDDCSTESWSLQGDWSAYSGYMGIGHQCHIMYMYTALPPAPGRNVDLRRPPAESSRAGAPSREESDGRQEDKRRPPPLQLICNSNCFICRACRWVVATANILLSSISFFLGSLTVLRLMINRHRPQPSTRACTHRALIISHARLTTNF